MSSQSAPRPTRSGGALLPEPSSGTHRQLARRTLPATRAPAVTWPRVGGASKKSSGEADGRRTTAFSVMLALTLGCK
eukprot:8395767-Alexandrium_andersonii.AAC.1